MSSREGLLELQVVGMSHRTAPIDAREALAFEPAQVRDALRLAKEEDALRETLILSTCNRTEAYCLAADPERAEARLRDLVSRLKGRDLLGPGPHRYLHRQVEAVRHLLRVASGLDSMVLGEMQILGQVKDAHSLAREAGATGPVLDRLLGSALHAGKRARAETEIGAGAVSVASAAVALATKVFGDLGRRHVLVVGAGETGRLAARHFGESRPARLLIANRTLAKAEELAAELGGEALPLGALPEALSRVDVVVCATRAPGVVISEELVRRVVRERPDRPLVLVDIAVPRDVDPAVARLENVFLYPIDAVETLVDQNLARRRREVPRVEAIVEEETERFLAWMRSLGAVPLLRELREHFERVRAEEVGKSLKHFSLAEQERIEHLTKALINKLLHLPTTRLKALDPASEAGLARLHVVRELFDLGAGEGTGGGVGRG